MAMTFKPPSSPNTHTHTHIKHHSKIKSRQTRRVSRYFDIKSLPIPKTYRRVNMQAQNERYTFRLNEEKENLFLSLFPWAIIEG